MSSDQQPWYENMSAFLTPKNMLRFFPAKDMNPTERFNALSRLVIYASLLALWRQYSPRTVLYASTASIGLLVATHKKQQQLMDELDDDDDEQVEQMNATKPVESYLSKESNEAFPGANNTARALTTSTKEVSGRSVIASTKDEIKNRQRPISRAKGIDSTEYDYMSGAVGANKPLMNLV